MTDKQIKERLEQEMGDVPVGFRCAMQAAFAQMVGEDTTDEAPVVIESVAAQDMPRHQRHTPHTSGGRARHMVVLVAVLMLLLSSFAVAAVVRPELLQIFWGREFQMDKRLETYRKTQAVTQRIGDYRVSVEEAIYDGVSLYVQYSIRDMTSDTMIGQAADESGVRYLTNDDMDAIASWPVGSWTDAIWINGHETDMPGMSGSKMWAGDEPGEVIFSEMYRLDQEGIALSGEARIALPIGQKQHQTREFIQANRLEDGTRPEPDAGMLSFSLNADAPVVHHAQGPTVVLPDGSRVWLKQADDTLMKCYVTLGYEVSEQQKAAYTAQYGEGMIMEDGSILPWPDSEMLGAWPYRMTLVDKQGNALCQALSYAEGLWGIGNGEIHYVFPHMEMAWEEIYVAPINSDGTVEMERAIPLG